MLETRRGCVKMGETLDEMPMPVDLPPAQTAPDPGRWPTQARQSLGDAAAPLSAAYQRTAKALGVDCVGVSVLTVTGDVPVGLQALLERHNPALLDGLGLPSQNRFVPNPHRVIRENDLATADREALGWLVSEGLLQATPGLTVMNTGSGGLTATRSPNRSQISLDPDVVAQFNGSVPFHDRLDPVLFRWLALFHEAGHAQMALDEAPFDLPGLSASERQAINRSLRGPSSHADPFGQVFGEAYADSFAVLSLLRLTHSSKASLAVVDYMRQARHRDEVVARGKGFDPHATSGALDRLWKDLSEDPARLDAVRTASPAQVRQWASHYASYGATVWAHSVEAVHPALGWSLVRPDSTETPVNQAKLINAFFLIQSGKVATYTRARLSAYLDAGDQGSPALPQTDGDPMLEALAAQDGAFFHTFQTHGDAADHRLADRILNAPPFSPSGQMLIDNKLASLEGVSAVTRQILAAATEYLDQDAHVRLEGDFQHARGVTARAALLRASDPMVLWTLPAAVAPSLTSEGSATLASAVDRVRRRQP